MQHIRFLHDDKKRYVVQILPTPEKLSEEATICRLLSGHVFIECERPICTVPQDGSRAVSTRRLAEDFALVLITRDNDAAHLNSADAVSYAKLASAIVRF